MRVPTLPAILTALTLAALPTAGASAASVAFHITDETDPAEVTETTTIYINGQLVAHFELSAEHPFGDVAVSVPRSDRYDYALCGRITVRMPDGHTETHVLDDGASLGDPSGKRLEALASDGFTTFFLAERAAGGTDAPTDLHKTNVCSIPTS